MITDLDYLRLEYEFTGADIPSLCAKYGFSIMEIERLAADQNWVQHTPDNDQEFYSKVRRELSVLMSRRAISTFARIQKIESDLIGKIEDLLVMNDMVLGDQAIGRIARAISTIQSSNKIFETAIQTSAAKEARDEGIQDEDRQWTITFVNPEDNPPPPDDGDLPDPNPSPFGLYNAGSKSTKETTTVSDQEETV